MGVHLKNNPKINDFIYVCKVGLLGQYLQNIRLNAVDRDAV